MNSRQTKQCDVCIIGSGPAGLAVLSALREPYSVDTMSENQWGLAATQLNKVGRSKKLNITVIDPNDEWLGGWRDNFMRLGIRFLRSPAIAHPDHFDMRALLAYAIANNREDELIESGCSEIRKLHGLGQTQVGLWKLPSSSLFEDFARDLAKSLLHDYVKSLAVDIERKHEDEGYIVRAVDGTQIHAGAVVLALGQCGNAVVPKKLRCVPKHQLTLWNHMQEKLLPDHEFVLVVGGGLTAVQAAQYCLRQGKRVVLCSRRPLLSRHFDLEWCWFDRRTANKHVSDFYHQSENERLRQLRDVRGGGSVPPLYMEDLHKWEQSGKLTIVNNVEPEFLRMTHDKALISVGEKTIDFHCVILACGVEADCMMNPFVRKVREKFPITVVGGYPCVNTDLEWTKNLYVVGALSSLNVGPDAGNVMGARRAASIVAGALDCKSWLRKEEGTLSNKFQALLDEDEASSDSDDD